MMVAGRLASHQINATHNVAVAGTNSVGVTVGANAMGFAAAGDVHACGALTRMLRNGRRHLQGGLAVTNNTSLDAPLTAGPTVVFSLAGFQLDVVLVLRLPLFCCAGSSAGDSRFIGEFLISVDRHVHQIAIAKVPPGLP